MNKPDACPACGSDKLNELFSIDSSSVTSQLIPGSDPERQKRCKSTIEKIWSSNISSFYRCNTCSFEFASPFVAADADLYSLIYHSENQYPASKWEYTQTLNSIDKYITSLSHKPTLLEVGAGNGSFLKLILNNRIPPEQIMATEYSDAGKKAIEGLGIQCFNKDFKSITEQELSGKVNIICLFQVLEHMTGIHDFFIHMNLITFKGSRLYLSLPNYYHRVFFDRHKYYFDLPPVHVGRYNAKSLGTLAENYGWRILQYVIQPTTYLGRVKKFLFSRYAYLQGSIQTEKFNLKLLRLFLRYTLYLFLILYNIRVIAGLYRSNLGTSEWFELERIK